MKSGMRSVFALIFLIGALACRTGDLFIAEATATPSRTPRPTFTPIPTMTNTVPPPTNTSTPAPSATATKKPATPRPPTAKPPTAAPQPTAVPPPPVSTFEFHANPPNCSHSGLTFIKGTVYLDKNDPNSKYVGAIVALGPPDGSTIYEKIKTDDYGEYTFVLGAQGQARPGNWGLWLVTPSGERKSDVGGPINTNNLPADNPQSCWAGSVDFWK